MKIRSLLFSLFFASVTFADTSKIPPPSDELQKQLHLSAFYKKSLNNQGLWIVSSEKPSDFALHEAAWIIDHVLANRDDLRQALIKANVRIVVMAHNEFTTDVPEHSKLRPPKDSKLTGQQYWDRRARGLGGTRSDPLTSCGEENLLNLRGDPYRGENILIHEFAHIIHNVAIRNTDPEMHKKINEAWKSARDEGLWKNTYAITDDNEYFAECTQSWFDCNAKNNAVHNDIDTRDKLKKYDPRMADLLTQIFRNNDWRYTPTTQRPDAPHLKGFDRAAAPTFVWPAKLPPREAPRGFIHPGILNTKETLAFVKSKVAANQQPWKDAFDKMKALPLASLDYQPKPHEQVNCGSGSRPDFGCSDEKRDSQAAYLHALLWVMTDDQHHAEKSAQILKAWCILQSHGLSNANLQAGWTGGPFLRAAEILRHTYPQWSREDQQAFTEMINRAFLPRIAEPQKSSFNGNWEAVMIETALSIAVFTDDRALFDSAIARFKRLLPAYIYGLEDGPVPLTIDPAHFDTREKIDKHWHGQTILFDGLSQETGRDLTHTQWGIGGLINCAEIAWNQGIDLYAQRDNRLLRGMEFHAKYLNGAPVPQDLQKGRLRGANRFCPAWEIGFNHYHNRKNRPMPETQKLLEENRPEIGPDHHLSFATLTHYGTK